MPVPTLDQLKEQEVSLRKLMAGQAESVDPAKKRELGKKIRRVQRKRRRLAVVAERRAVKPTAATEAKPVEAAPEETKPVESAPEEVKPAEATPAEADASEAKAE